MDHIRLGAWRILSREILGFLGRACTCCIASPPAEAVRLLPLGRNRFSLKLNDGRSLQCYGASGRRATIHSLACISAADALVAAFTKDGTFCNADTYPGVTGRSSCRIYQRPVDSFSRLSHRGAKCWRNRARVGRPSQGRAHFTIVARFLISSNSLGATTDLPPSHNRSRSFQDTENI